MIPTKEITPDGSDTVLGIAAMAVVFWVEHHLAIEIFACTASSAFLNRDKMAWNVWSSPWISASAERYVPVMSGKTGGGDD